MKNIVLYITYDGLCDPLGESQIIPYVQGLSERGYLFHLISCEKIDRYSNHRERIKEKLLPYGIKWSPIIFYKKPPLLSTLFNLYNVYIKAIDICTKHEISLVHCRSYLPSIIGLKLKNKYEIPFVFDMRGFWIEERLEGGLWNIKNPLYNFIYKYFKMKERDFFLCCDACVSLTQRGKIEILNRFKEESIQIPVFIIPCSVSFESFSIPLGEEIAAKKVEIGIPEKSFVLSYSGSIGTWYMLGEMMSFYKTALTKYPEAYFLILTSDNPLIIEEKAKELGVNTNQIIVRFVTREQMPKIISISNLSICFIRPTFSKIASSPTKLGELFALGIPVICNTGIGDVDLVVQQVGGGIVLKEFSEEAYNSVLSNYANANYSKSNIRNNAEQYYELSHAVNTYYSMYQEVLNKQPMVN